MHRALASALVLLGVLLWLSETLGDNVGSILPNQDQSEQGTWHSGEYASDQRHSRKLLNGIRSFPAHGLQSIANLVAGLGRGRDHPDPGQSETQQGEDWKQMHSPHGQPLRSIETKHSHGHHSLLHSLPEDQGGPPQSELVTKHLNSSRHDVHRHYTPDKGHGHKTHRSQAPRKSEDEPDEKLAPVMSTDRAKFQLTRERIQAIAAEKGGPLMVTWANYKYFDYVLNWIAHLERISVSNYMIGTMDEELLEALIAKGEKNVFFMNADEVADDMSAGTPFFFAMGRDHCRLMEIVVGMGVDALFSDIDTVWLRDPFPYLARYPNADILVSSDKQSTTTNEDALENYLQHANIGVVLFRQSALGFLQELNFRLDLKESYWEQQALQDLLGRNVSGIGEREDRLFRGYNGTLWIGTLPVSLFASGHTYFSQNLAEVLGAGVPYVVHNSYMSGRANKRHRFRERLLWLVDPDEYYDPPGGLISFDMDVEGFLEPTRSPENTVEGFMPHFKLINHQLLQLRSAIAFSVVLNRTLVLPNFWSGADKLLYQGLLEWGVWPKSQVTWLPRQFPADHILQIERLSHWNLNSSDQELKFREYSFLQNPRTPSKILQQSLQIKLCQDKQCGSRFNKSTQEMYIKAGLSDQDVAFLFKDFRDVKLLHFTDLRGAFRGFVLESDQARFENQTRSYTAHFCCLDPHGNGLEKSVYDMWWDTGEYYDQSSQQGWEWQPKFNP